MERWVENTLATLGIIVTTIFVIAACGFVFLLAICFGVLNSSGSFNRANPPTPFPSGAYAIMFVIIVAGITVISILARGMLRRTQPSSYPPGPLGPVPTIAERIDLGKIAPTTVAPAKPAPPPAVHETISPPRNTVPLNLPTRPIRDLAAHLSPASRIAIQQLAIAITAKIAAEVVLGLVGWYGALGSPRVPFPVYRFGFLAWGLAAIAPHIVLLYALARKPGPRAFAYALVIPTLHILLGIFGHSAFLAFILRAGQVAAPLLSIAPWILDIVILYLAWKAIRQTGIHPNPARLIIASVVIVFYTSLLPVLVVVLNGLQH